MLILHSFVVITAAALCLSRRAWVHQLPILILVVQLDGVDGYSSKAVVIRILSSIGVVTVALLEMFPAQAWLLQHFGAELSTVIEVDFEVVESLCVDKILSFL